jgi:hypothetical protein
MFDAMNMVFGCSECLLKTSQQSFLCSSSGKKKVPEASAGFCGVLHLHPRQATQAKLSEISFIKTKNHPPIQLASHAASHP